MITPEQMTAVQGLLKGSPQTNPVNSGGGGSWYDQMQSVNLPGQNAQPKQQNTQSFGSKVSNTIQDIFPGKQLGNAIGNDINGAVQAIKQKSFQPILNAGQENNQNYGKIAGDVAQIPLTVGAPLVGGGGTPLGRIGANAALGVGLGATNAISQGQSVGDVAKSGALGGALGGGISGVGEVGNYLTKNMPNWFTKLALPKLGNNVKGTPQETIDYALNNTKGASLNKMYSNSKTALTSHESQIQAVLNHPQYANETGNVAKGLDVVQSSHAQAGLDSKKIVNIIKQVAPENKTIVDKVAAGTATLQEQNTLRKELDQATKAAYGDKPNLSFAKSVGKSMSDFLRGNVQGTAKETVPIFSEYSKEHALNKSLNAALNKKRVAGPLVAGAAGFAGGGFKGAAEAIAVEEGLRSPTARLLAAKGIRSAGKLATPIVKTAFQGGKAALIKSATGSRK